jgi:hypothetical protein
MTAAKRYESIVSESSQREGIIYIYLGVVLCITSVHGNGLQIKTTSEVDGSDNVPAGSGKSREIALRVFRLRDSNSIMVNRRHAEKRTVRRSITIQLVRTKGGKGGKKGKDYTDWSVGTMPCTAVISGTLPGGSFEFVLGAATLL